MKKTIALFSLLILLGLTNMSVAQIISTVAGNHIQGYSGSGGAATSAELDDGALMTFDSKGNMYIVNYLSNVVEMVNTSGIITTVIGSYPGGLHSGDGGPATAAGLFGPIGIAIDKSGNFYVSEYNDCCVRKVNTSGIISTIAGNSSYGAGFSGDGGPATAAELRYPYGVAVDSIGNIYIADGGNEVIRIVNSSGIINTYAGNHTYGAGYSGDGGPATDAEMSTPWGLFITKTGDLIFADNRNNVIRQINTAGIITTIAGNHMIGGGYSGDGGLATNAQLNQPTFACMDNKGNMYIADWQNNLVRGVSTSGIINTIGGNYSYGIGYSGDGGPATDAELYQPTGIALDSLSNIYFTDSQNQVVRKIGSIINALQNIQNDNSVIVYPNPAKDKISINVTSIGNPYLLSIYSINGQLISQQKSSEALVTVDVNLFESGIYFVLINFKNGDTSINKIEVMH